MNLPEFGCEWKFFAPSILDVFEYGKVGMLILVGKSDRARNSLLPLVLARFMRGYNEYS